MSGIYSRLFLIKSLRCKASCSHTRVYRVLVTLLRLTQFRFPEDKKKGQPLEAFDEAADTAQAHAVSFARGEDSKAAQ